MKILVTNDDGWYAKGIQTLVEIMRPYGEITVIAPKKHQSGMSMAVNLGRSPIAVKKIKDEPGVSWWYLDGTPSSCVKFGIDNIYFPEKPDLVLSGINHGGNYGTAYCYSGTIGAASEGALAGIPSIAVSLDAFKADADFSAVSKFFPAILEKLIENHSRDYGMIYNVNFPALPASEIKGVRLAKQAVMRWEREFQPFDHKTFEMLSVMTMGRSADDFPIPEDGEEQYMMVGEVVNDSAADPLADMNLIRQGYVTISCHRLLSHDLEENARLAALGIESEL